MDLWESMITQVFPQLVCNRYYLNLNMYELPIYKIEQMHLLQITKEWNFFKKKTLISPANQTPVQSLKSSNVDRRNGG